MRNPKDFNEVVCITFLLCFFIYGSIAFIGYLMYGNEVEQEITLNMAHSGGSLSLISTWMTGLGQITKFTMALIPCISYILHFSCLNMASVAGLFEQIIKPVAKLECNKFHKINTTNYLDPASHDKHNSCASV